jgi:hypothetical protein
LGKYAKDIEKTILNCLGMKNIPTGAEAGLEHLMVTQNVGEKRILMYHR